MTRYPSFLAFDAMSVPSRISLGKPPNPGRMTSSALGVDAGSMASKKLREESFGLRNTRSAFSPLMMTFCEDAISV